MPLTFVHLLHGIDFVKTVCIAVDGDHLGSGDFSIGALKSCTGGRDGNEAWREPGRDHGTHRSECSFPLIIFSVFHHVMVLYNIRPYDNARV